MRNSKNKAIKTENRYNQIIKNIFDSHFKPGIRQFTFDRNEISRAVKKLGVKLPKNIGDLIYSFRYRIPLPESIRKKAPSGNNWVIKPAGPAKYRFVAVTVSTIKPSSNLAITKTPDATPGIIAMYAFSDEQALLAKLRYNRLIDIFSGITCYSLQSHLRTSVKGIGQIETDEVYVGIDKRGAHFVFPVQAKGHRDRISVVQIEQDYDMCQEKFPNLLCRPIAAQFISRDLIALFEFEKQSSDIAICSERHYRLVDPDEIQAGDLKTYKSRKTD